MKHSRLFTCVFILCATAGLVPLWCGTYLPLTDLPQHVAQISVLRNYFNSVYDYGRYFEINLMTPYAFTTLTGAFFNLFFPVMVAVKILLSLILLSFPLSLYCLLNESDGDPEWALVGSPLAFGASFFWGHLPFVNAVPISIFCWSLAFRYHRTRTRATGLCFTLLMTLLFFCHLVPFVIACFVSLVIFWNPRTCKFYWPGLLSMIPPFSLFFFWLKKFNTDSSFQDTITWQLGWHRLFEIPQLIMGFEGDGVSHIAFVGILVGFFFFPRKQKAGFTPFLPFLGVFLLCLFLPFQISSNINYFAQRIAVFLAPALLLTFRSDTAPPHRKKYALISIAGVFLLWAGVLSARVIEFNKEATSFDALLEKMTPHKRVAGLVLDKTSSVPSFLPYVHFPAYYQALKGGRFEYSFSNVSQIVARYQAPSRLTSTQLGHTWEQIFNDSTYDYYLFRLPPNTALKERKDRKLIMSSGRWFLYEQLFPLN